MPTPSSKPEPSGADVGAGPPGRIEVLTGGRAGLLFPLNGPLVTLGRGADCHLRLEPDADLAVSARHAVLHQRPDGWAVRDLGSRNGTFLNGMRIDRETALGDGDRVGLGEGGPVLLFHLGDPVATGAREGGAPARRTTRHLVAAALAGGVVIVVGLGAFLFADRSARRSWSAERARMQSTLDSLHLQSQATEAALRGQVGGLAAALRGSRTEVDSLRVALGRADASGDRRGGAALQARLQVATSALRTQQRAASLDFAGIQRANRHAVAMLYVEYEDGRIATGTAFAVRPDGTMITNRHVLLGPDGHDKPHRIGIQFSDSEQVWPARLLAASQSVDLALLAVENIEGAVPTVQGLNLRADTLPRNAPVALIGFPHGGDQPSFLAGGQRVVRPSIGAGVLRQTAGDRLQVQGYGAEGASGTPIFDARGHVLGVLFGGRQEEGAQMLYAVPAAAAAQLMATQAATGR